MSFSPRRESPWKLDGESTSVSSKLKLLEQELLNLENIGNSDLSKVPSLMRKQAKRYQALAGKIDDLCRRMVMFNRPCFTCFMLFYHLIGLLVRLENPSINKRRYNRKRKSKHKRRRKKREFCVYVKHNALLS